jgi:hypothetical protein
LCKINSDMYDAKAKKSLSLQGAVQNAIITC